LLLTVNEAADKLRASKYTVYRMIQNGDLPAIRGRGKNRLLVQPEAVDALIASDRTPVQGPQVYTAAETAAILRCGIETVYRLVKAGVLRASRNPGSNSHLRIPADAVEAYLSEQRVPAEAS
jgi:excisionase family DNA binding protein